MKLNALYLTPSVSCLSCLRGIHVGFRAGFGNRNGTTERKEWTADDADAKTTKTKTDRGFSAECADDADTHTAMADFRHWQLEAGTW